MASASVSFDKPVYVPGDLITMTITVTLPADEPPITRAIAGELTLNTGERVTFSGTVQLDDRAVTIDSATITNTGGLAWSAPTVAGNIITMTADY